MAQLPKAPPNPHQESIDKLANRVLPLVRAMAFAQNRKEPWLGNATVDKAVIATIETCFALADQDRLLAAQQAAPVEPPVEEELPAEAQEQLPELTHTSDTQPPSEGVTEVVTTPEG
jgi:hypothetical protein